MIGDPRLVLAALFAAVAVASAVRLVVPPPRALGGRVRPYAQLSRSRLGVGSADASVLDVNEAGNALREMVVPMLRRLAEALGNVVDLGDRSSVELRLRHAGWGEVSAEQYRMRQLASTVVGLVLGTALGLVLLDSAAAVLAMAVLAGYFGASRWRGRVDRAVRRRRESMRAELYTLTQLLAVYARTGHGPVEAVREVARRGRGPVAAELGEALGWIAGGTGAQPAYQRLAETTPEPMAARLYRMLGAAVVAGGDVARPLLALSEDVRGERRDEVARAAIRRRSAMLLPLLVLIAPTMLLFIAAALPHVVFGS